MITKFYIKKCARKSNTIWLSHAMMMMVHVLIIYLRNVSFKNTPVLFIMKLSLTVVSKNSLCPVKVTLKLTFEAYVSLCVDASRWKDEISISHFEHWQPSESPRLGNDSILCFVYSHIIILSFYLERKMINYTLIRMNLLDFWRLLGIKRNRQSTRMVWPILFFINLLFC